MADEKTIEFMPFEEWDKLHPEFWDLAQPDRFWIYSRDRLIDRLRDERGQLEADAALGRRIRAMPPGYRFTHEQDARLWCIDRLESDEKWRMTQIGTDADLVAAVGLEVKP